MAEDPSLQGTEAQPAQSQGSDVAGAWRDWMTNPENRASLMQFGISMLQPVGVGQSQQGHFGQALGQAGEAATRVRGEDLARRKAEADISYKEERGNLATERANVAGSNLLLQQEKAELARMLGSSQRATELLKNFEAAKLLNPELTLQQYIQRHQQAIKIIQSEGRDQGGTLPSAGVGGAAAPKIGDVVKGYRYKGGPPSAQSSWEQQ